MPLTGACPDADGHRSFSCRRGIPKLTAKLLSAEGRFLYEYEEVIYLGVRDGGASR